MRKHLFLSLMCCGCLSLSAGKNRRLKQAKEEAQAEIEQYRLQREKEFKTKEAAVRHCTTDTTYNNAHNTTTQIPQQLGRCVKHE